MADIVKFTIRGSSAREQFVNAVEDVKAEVLSRRPKLSEADALKQAADIVARDAPQLLTGWRSAQS